MLASTRNLFMKNNNFDQKQNFRDSFSQKGCEKFGVFFLRHAQKF